MTQWQKDLKEFALESNNYPNFLKVQGKKSLSFFDEVLKDNSESHINTMSFILKNIRRDLAYVALGINNTEFLAYNNDEMLYRQYFVDYLENLDYDVDYVAQTILDFIDITQTYCVLLGYFWKEDDADLPMPSQYPMDFFTGNAHAYFLREIWYSHSSEERMEFKKFLRAHALRVSQFSDSDLITDFYNPELVASSLSTDIRKSLLSYSGSCRWSAFLALLS